VARPVICRTVTAGLLALTLAPALAAHANGRPKSPPVSVYPAPKLAPQTQRAQTPRPHPKAIAAASVPVAPALDRVVCVAGCGNIEPIVVQERPHVPYVEPAKSPWMDVTLDVQCADGYGCRARNVIPNFRRYCSRSWR
jgi:hypothetical protein